MNLETQLVAELGDAAYRVASLLGPDEAISWPNRITQKAANIAASLRSDDEQEAAQTVIDLMAALWPHANPEQIGQAGWWRTPLGQACARSAGMDDTEAVTRREAAKILDVTEGTIDQLLHRGTLARHPDGGVVRADVLRRMERLL